MATARLVLQTKSYMLLTFDCARLARHACVCVFTHRLV